MKQRLVIKGTILTYGEKWVVGNEDYSSILLSVANSWKSNNFSPQDELTVNIESWKSREFGKIKSSIYGYTSDLHNLSINYCFLKETLESSEINKHKANLYVSLLLENYFTNIRSLYDFLFHIIKICLTDKQLKTYPETDSLNKLIKFSKNKNNKEKLPERIQHFLLDIEPYLDEIRTIRDFIVHKGKEIIITKKDNQLFIRIPKTGLYSNDNLMPNILNSLEVDYNMEDYIRELTKSIFKYSEDLGMILLIELFEKEKFDWNLYSITNYCMEDFTEFMLKQKNFG
ncbi:hypothetical protein [Polaribacter sp. NJDZ03]|uniref:hypothetical protein n=1 Tax=Polaribacter sp. NJDZ03 TaxID=2855841 RepID=UPI001C4A0739|nr:hypothetical protein [Polaribacter sp. NJDZ03]